MWVRRAAQHALTIAITIVLGGLLGATLVRVAPGFGVDEQELDPRLREESIQALRKSRLEQSNILRFYAGYLGRTLRGDLGRSRALQRPISQLFAERIPVTLRSVAAGLVLAWVVALLLAVAGLLWQTAVLDFLAGLFSGGLLCLPAAVVALVFLFFGGGVPLAIAAAVFPKVYRYTRNLLFETYGLPHVVTARAKGLGRLRILLWHLFPSVAPQIVALLGVSVSMALGAAIPIEVICDSPGIAQLAWQAALARDLPLIVNLTILITVATLLANSVSDLAVAATTTPSR